MVAAIVCLSGCAAPTTLAPTAPVAGDAETRSGPAGSAETSAGGSGSGAGAPTNVLVVVEENHAAAAVLHEMPYLAVCPASSGRPATTGRSPTPRCPTTWPSRSTFGVTDDRASASHPITQLSVLDAAVGSGRTARTYAEVMPQARALTADGRYAVKHNPWACFSSPASRANCQQFDVPAGTTDHEALHDDLLAGALPTVGLLVPDLCNDGHDCRRRSPTTGSTSGLRS